MIYGLYSTNIYKTKRSQSYFNSFGNSQYELFPFAYNDKRLMELVLITARYKVGLMEKLANEVYFDLKGNKHYERSVALLKEFENISENLKD